MLNLIIFIIINVFTFSEHEVSFTCNEQFIHMSMLLNKYQD